MNQTFKRYLFESPISILPGETLKLTHTLSYDDQLLLDLGNADEELDEGFIKFLEDESNYQLKPLEEEQPKKCTCPEENFYYNGIGCKCGGN